MKLLVFVLVFVLVLFSAFHVWAQPTTVQKTICTGTAVPSTTQTYNLGSAGTCTGTFNNVTVNHGVIVNLAVQVINPQVSTFTDTLGCSTWQRCAPKNIAGLVDLEQWYTPWCPAGTLQPQITWGAKGGGNITYEAHEMNGIINCDQGNINHGSGTAATTGSITTTQADDYLDEVMIKDLDVAPTAGPSGGFAASQSQLTSAPFMWTGDQGVTVTGNYSSGYTIIYNNWSMLIGSFYTVSATPTPTSTATPSTTPTGVVQTPTATPTVSCNPSASPTPTSTPTATPIPACPVPAVVATSFVVPIASPTTSVTFTYPYAISAGDWPIFNAGLNAPADWISKVIDNVNNINWSNVPGCGHPNQDIEVEQWWYPRSIPASANTLTVTVNFQSAITGNITASKVSGITGLDQIGQCNTGTDVNLFTGIVPVPGLSPFPSILSDFIFGGIAQTGFNGFGSVQPTQPVFSALAVADMPLEVPLYVSQNQSATAQAEVTSSGTAQDYVGRLITFSACPSGGSWW